MEIETTTWRGQGDSLQGWLSAKTHDDKCAILLHVRNARVAELIRQRLVVTVKLFDANGQEIEIK